MTSLLQDISPHRDPSAVDPHLQPAYLLGVAAATGQRAVEVQCQDTGWSVRYALLLQAHGPGWLARTPDYGGPVLAAADPATAAPLARAAIDRVLAEHAVASEVSQASPWLPHVDAISTAWGWRPTKPVSLLPLPVDPERLSHGRRADLRAWSHPVAHAVFARDAALAFSVRYAEAMDRLGATERWRFDSGYFSSLADTGLIRQVSTGDERGGATSLFLMGAARAVYLFSVRWGKAPGASSQVLWHAADAFAGYGVTELLLGGGASSDPDDHLLAFKRSWGGRDVPHLVGARCFDEAAQRAAEHEGARPLPEGWVMA